MIIKSILLLIGKSSLTILLYVFSFILAAMLTQADSSDPSSEMSSSSSDGQTGLIFLFIGTIIGLVLAWYLYRTKGKRWPTVANLFLLIFGVHTLLPQMESCLFQSAVGMDQKQLISIVLMGFISALIFACIAPFTWRKPTTDNTPTLAFPSSWKVWLSLPLLYVLLYFLFGYFVAWQSPDVRTYYQGSTDILPFFAHMQSVIQEDIDLIFFQWFRGFIWTILAWILIRSTQASYLEKVLLTACFFAAPAVILLLPNPYMPEAVRWVHLIETASSNFLFGAVVTFYLLKYCRVKETPTL